ncbi:MAG: Synerg-CTERM sorting domain-containing protein [Synergistota bacterium]|nr:Synerg-CTERM sorting domain-containing protein [Synergistota bacterium]
MKKLQLFITVVLLLFAFACPSFAADPTLDPDNMAFLNGEIAAMLTSPPIPAGIQVELEFGRFTENDVPSIETALGKDIWFFHQMDLSSLPAGSATAEWAGEADLSSEMDFDTFLGAAGFYLPTGIDQSDPKTLATVVTLKMTLSKTFLVSQGVPQTEVDALFAANPVDAQISFFDQFSYYKIFEGADPAIDPRDIVEFVKSEYTSTFPEFVYFDVDNAAETLTVGIRYILVDDVPPNGEPFMIDKNIVIIDGTEQTTGVLFIYDGKRDKVLKDPVSLGDETAPAPTPTPSGSSGGCSTGLPLMLVLLGIPFLFYRKR